MTNEEIEKAAKEMYAAHSDYYGLATPWEDARISTKEILRSCVKVHLKQTASLTARLAEAEKDKRRLDWMDAQSNGSSWVARESNTGRGFRLHNTGEDSSHWPIARGTARGAIDAAMEGGK